MNEKLKNWCASATAQIRYKPDRAEVEAELMAHIEDKADALRGKGVPEEEINGEVLRSMGSAEAIAPQLAAIHKPWLRTCAPPILFSRLTKKLRTVRFGAFLIHFPESAAGPLPSPGGAPLPGHRRSGTASQRSLRRCQSPRTPFPRVCRIHPRPGPQGR